MSVETTGAIHHKAIRRLRVLWKRVRGMPKGDRTRYGRASQSTRSYIAHHSQQISKAAVLGDANEVIGAIRKLKRRANLCASSAPAVAGAPSPFTRRCHGPAHALVNVVHTG